VESKFAEATFKQEIVELPAVLIDIRPEAGAATRGKHPGTVAAVFHTFVRPTENPKLNYDTTSFVPITQAQVDAAPTLEIALRGFTLFNSTVVGRLAAREPHSLAVSPAGSRNAKMPSVLFKLVKTSTVNESMHVVGELDDWSLVAASVGESADAKAAMATTLSVLDAEPVDEPTDRLLLATDGPWDIACFLAHEAHRKSLLGLWKPYMTSWWNIRWEVGRVFNGGSARGLNVATQLSTCGLRFMGKEHSGLHDTLNIAAVARVLLFRGCAPKANDGLAAGATTLVGRVYRPPWYRGSVTAAVARA